MKPDLSKGLECHVDADWAGSWTHRSSHDPSSNHSRTGFCITYAGCPLLWKSSMQSLIAKIESILVKTYIQCWQMNRLLDIGEGIK